MTALGLAPAQRIHHPYDLREHGPRGVPLPTNSSLQPPAQRRHDIAEKPRGGTEPQPTRGACPVPAASNMAGCIAANGVDGSTNQPWERPR